MEFGCSASLNPDFDMPPRDRRSKSQAESTKSLQIKRPAHEKKLLGNHQRSWIWGKHLVQETLAAGRWPVLELILADDLSTTEISRVRKSITHLDPVTASRKRLTQLCGSDEHQGWIARVGPFPYVPFEDLLNDQPVAPFWLLIDGIQDPYNLGTILRSAEVFAVTGVCLGTVNQTGVNSLAARSSVGAVNRLKISRGEDLLSIIKELRKREVSIIGTSLEATGSLDSIDCTGGVAVVVGNEGRGISPEVLKACSHRAKIPQPGKLNSLNAAAATAIACYEVQRQRRQKSPPR